MRNLSLALTLAFAATASTYAGPRQSGNLASDQQQLMLTGSTAISTVVHAFEHAIKDKANTGKTPEQVAEALTSAYIADSFRKFKADKKPLSADAEERVKEAAKLDVPKSNNDVSLNYALYVAADMQRFEHSKGFAAAAKILKNNPESLNNYAKAIKASGAFDAELDSENAVWQNMVIPANLFLRTQIAQHLNRAEFARQITAYNQPLNEVLAGKKPLSSLDGLADGNSPDQIDATAMKGGQIKDTTGKVVKLAGWNEPGKTLNGFFAKVAATPFVGQ